STTGTPEMLRARVSLSTSAMVVSGPTVNGSRITPASKFLTRATCAACASADMFLWRMLMPPSWARAMARRDSLTVSIAAETIGRRMRRSRVSRVSRDTSLGRTVECAGTSETSSYVSASAWMRSIGSPGRGGEARHYSAFAGPLARVAAASPAPSATQRLRVLRLRLRRRLGQFGRLQGVLHQRGHGHRPDPARHRADPAGALRGGVEAHVADQPAVVQPVDADVDHHRA